MIPFGDLKSDAAARRTLRRCATAVVVGFCGLLTQRPFSPPVAHAQDEVRALWVVRTSLTSASAISTMVSAARASGFNTLLVQVRGRADAYYANALEPRAVQLSGQPQLDPLGMTVQLAHAAGVRVHAWINVNLVAGANELPTSRDHVVYRHPDWLMVPRALAEDMVGRDPLSPEYLGRLARYTRSVSAEVEGLYLSPIPDGSADYSVGVVRSIVERYDLDGVHFDYVRYPSDDFDYSREALAAFRRSVWPDLAPADRKKLDGRLANEPLLYTQAFPQRWHAFRTDRMTALLVRLRDEVKTVRPSALVSVAVGPDPAEAAAHKMQDWRAWLSRDLVDVLCPMAYTTDGQLFATQIATARDLTGNHPLWAGIGAYRLSSDQIVDRVQTARRLGVGGVILFSYDSLTGPSRGPDYLTQLGRAAFLTSQF